MREGRRKGERKKEDEGESEREESVRERRLTSTNCPCQLLVRRIRFKTWRKLTLRTFKRFFFFEK